MRQLFFCIRALSSGGFAFQGFDSGTVTLREDSVNSATFCRKQKDRERFLNRRKRRLFEWIAKERHIFHDFKDKTKVPAD
jgi:hypothetical protein